MNFPKLIDTIATPKLVQNTEVTPVSIQRTVVMPLLLPNYMGGTATYSSALTEKQLIICVPDSKEVKTLYPTGTVLHGTLNYISVFSDEGGNFYTWRTPKEHPEILPKIHKDLLGTGFLANGRTYKFRTNSEQVNFMQKAHQLNLSSVVAVYADKFGILLPFVQGISYDSYLRLGGITATKNVLDNILLAHKQNIVYGDRWAKNTIVRPDESIVEIDFDIELIGDNIQEFEIAQLLYHMFFFSSRRNEMVEFIEKYLQTNKAALTQYNIFTINSFLSNYINYFQDQTPEGILGGIKQEIVEIINVLLRLSK